MNYFRAFWLGVYVVAAVVAAGLFAARGMLGGDFAGVPLSDLRTLIVAAGSVVLFYLLWMGPVYKVMEKMTVSPLFTRSAESVLPDDDRQISIFVLILQISFLIYCFIEGVGIAGSIKRVDLVIKNIWVLLPADVIFMVYYALYRKSRWFTLNLIVYIFSNTLRGWLGFWFIILFLEGAFRIREKRLDWRKTSLMMALLVYLAPFLIAIKVVIRGSNSTYLNIDSLFSIIKNVNWWESVVRTSEKVLMRMQHLDVVIVIINNATVLANRLKDRKFLYFFEEGLPQFTVERLLNWPRVPDLHIKVIHFFHPSYSHISNYQELGGITNTHTGLVSWFWIVPQLAPLYLAYILMLTWAGIWLAKKLDATGGVVELVWFAVLFWIMNGWFGAYIEFLQALVVVIVAKILASKLNVKF